MKSPNKSTTSTSKLTKSPAAPSKALTSTTSGVSGYGLVFEPNCFYLTYYEGLDPDKLPSMLWPIDSPHIEISIKDLCDRLEIGFIPEMEDELSTTTATARQFLEMFGTDATPSTPFSDITGFVGSRRLLIEAIEARKQSRYLKEKQTATPEWVEEWGSDYAATFQSTVPNFASFRVAAPAS